MAKPSAKTKPPCAPRRRWLPRILLAVFAPVVFLLLLEGILALTGLVEPVRLLQQVEHEGKAYWTTDPGYGRFIFPREGGPTPSQVWVPVEKKPGEKRVVLIGESAAHGFPLTIFNLARVTDAFWQRAHPATPARVTGLTMTGINSHILRLFVHEALRMEPDMLVIYAGHNEVIGPFGPASVFGRHRASLPLIRAHLWAKRTRTAVLLGRVAQLVQRDHAAASWRGLAEFEQTRIAFDDPALDTMMHHARENFSAMLHDATVRGVPVVLAAPAVNLNDWPPMESTPEIIPDEEAFRLARAGNLAQLTSAWQVYRLARNRERRGDLASAWPLYRRARDLDLYRFRFDSRLEALFLDLASAYRERGVTFIDTDPVLHELNPGFSSDRQYFVEHVHLTAEGRALVAGALVQAMARAWKLPSRGDVGPDQVLADLFYNEIHGYDLWSKTIELIAYPPFTRQPEHEERITYARRIQEDYRDRFSERWTIDAIFRAYQQAVQRRPDDEIQHISAGRMYSQRGHAASAEAALRQALQLHPLQQDALFNLLKLLIERRALDEALRVALLMEESAPVDGELLYFTGEIHIMRDEPRRALPYLERARRLRPLDARIMYSLGMCRQMLGDTAEAVATLRAYITTEPTDYEAMGSLSWIISTGRNPSPADMEQALALARQAVEADAENYRARGALAVALAASNDQATARREADLAIAAATADDQAAMIDELKQQLARLGVTVE